VAIKILKSIVFWYFVGVGITLHLSLGAFWYLEPELAVTAWDRALFGLTERLKILAWVDSARKQLSDAAIFSRIPAWTPLPEGPRAPPPGYARIGERLFPSPAAALAALKPGETLDIGAGVYTSPWEIRVPRVAIVGQGHVVFERGAAQGKGNMVIAADNVLVRNIECRLIRVPDENGACIRLEGNNLTVEHVYFHDSEEGILAGAAADGRVEIRDSRFEHLGKGGQAHGVYVGGRELVISDSLFLASQGEGHEIKSRAAKTTIVRSVIASMNGVDSRLIDVPNGGELTVTDSVLLKGPNSASSDAIGFALEVGPGYHPVDRVIVHNNLILLDRYLPSRLLRLRDQKIATQVSGNVIVSRYRTDYDRTNTVFRSRQAAGLPDYPALPLTPLLPAAASPPPPAKGGRP